MTRYSCMYAADDSPQGWHIEPEFVEKYANELRTLNAARYSSKLLFGTDVEISSPEFLGAHIASHKAIYTALGIDEEAQRAMMRDTAARLLYLQ